MLYCLVINVHFVLCCSSATLISYHVLFDLSTTFFNFFRLILALSKKAFRTPRCLVFVVVVRDSFVNIHPGIDKSQQHFSIFFQNVTFTKTYNFSAINCLYCTNASELLPRHKINNIIYLIFQ